MVEVNKEVDMNGGETIFGGAAGRLYAVVENVTPELAKEYLARNEENRALKKAFVNKLAGAIHRGEWVFNGESIKFDAFGRLIDGQHRLAAVAASDIAVPMLVVRNAPAGSQETVDTGTRRTLSDALRIRGERNNATLAAAIAWLFRLQNAKSQSPMRGDNYPTIQQGLALLDNNPGMRASMTVAVSLYGQLRVPQGLGTALHYLFRNIDEQDAEVFFEYLITGAALEEDDPIFTLRKSLQKIAREATGKKRFSQAYIGAIMVRAWNAYREGRTLKALSWSPGGSRKEMFPLPK